MDEEESILQEFLVECGEGVGRLDQEFVALEADPNDEALIGSIFRTIHTIKGTCGFLGLPKLENVAHGAENIRGTKTFQSQRWALPFSWTRLIILKTFWRKSNLPEKNLKKIMRVCEGY